jgi:putative cardiolipin synthase
MERTMPATALRHRFSTLVFAFAFLGMMRTDIYATSGSHSIRFLTSETEALSTRLELVQSATTSILIATYQIRDDNSGGQLIAALVDAASRGVDVRLLLDAHPNSNNLPKPLMRYLVERGLSLKERPFDVRSKVELGRPRLHDKLFIVDSTNLIIGGRNLEQDYFGLGNRKYIDFDVAVAGDVVCEIEAYFHERWSEPESATPKLVGREEPKMLKKQVHAHWNNLSYCEVVPAIDAWLAELRGSELQACDLPCRSFHSTESHDSCCVEFLRDFSSGSKRSPEAISSRMIDEIKSAKHSISISTPYFVVPIYLRNALIAASKRGVKVTLLTNSLDSTDQVVVHAGYANVRRSLIRNGIRIHEQCGVDPLHAKLIVIDGCKTIVGSHNLDMLSMKRNSEVGLLVDSTAFADEAMMLYQSLIVNSKCINHEKLFRYESRSHDNHDDKLEDFQRLRFVAPFIRRYL